ncbi:hypothetical protein [Candidatus Amarolinea dominans]|uniref:hypothetical protein n=1 Tax=Candidatus Amarolinea dominans TaxID=3140696 RepID=UPI0031CC9E96
MTPQEAKQLGLGVVTGLEKHIRLYRNGRDLTATSRNVMVIDLYGLTVEDVRRRFPEVYQWVYERVKPERDQNNRKSRRENWWLFGETNPKLRDQLSGLSRYIATVETSRHRFFVFLDKTILPDNKLVNIALEDGYFLGVLSSRIHTTWALKAGGWLGVGNDPVYVKTACFEKFSFPDAIDAQKARIRSIAEELDSHRKRQQALHPKLTLTDMYNVLARLRASEALTAKDKIIHAQGLVSILRQLHDDLDAAVAEAYGWPADLPDEEILTRLVALNAGAGRGRGGWRHPLAAAGLPGAGRVRAAGAASRVRDRGARNPVSRRNRVSECALARGHGRAGGRRTRRSGRVRRPTRHRGRSRGRVQRGRACPCGRMARHPGRPGSGAGAGRWALRGGVALRRSIAAVPNVAWFFTTEITKNAEKLPICV